MRSEWEGEVHKKTTESARARRPFEALNLRRYTLQIRVQRRLAERRSVLIIYPLEGNWS